MSLSLIGNPLTNSGIFTATAATAYTINNPNIQKNSIVVFSLNTVGGTPAGAPYVSLIVAGTSFNVQAGAGDTSVYNYLILNL